MNELQLINLFDDDIQKNEMKSILDIDLDNLNTGMSEYQLENFILNKKENTNALFLYKQVKLELSTRVQSLMDVYYQYKEKQLELEKLQYQMFNLKKRAENTLQEAKLFASKYNELKYLDNLDKKELDKMEEEGWKIKSAYYPEMNERYQITPYGRIKLPHEEGGIDTILKIMEENNGK